MVLAKATMGNGSSTSGTANTVQVEPVSSSRTSNFPVASTSGSVLATARPIYDHEPISCYPHSYGSVQPHQANGYYQPYLSPASYGHDQELDDTIEASVAPQWQYSGHNFQCQETRGMRVNSNSKAKGGQANDNNLDRTEHTSDEITFEVYHSTRDGRDYDLINTHGTRFYLDSWTTGEWQPFPNEWLKDGYIENVTRDQTRIVSTSDVQLYDDIQGMDTSSDDRMGSLDHPAKGHLTTYFMELNCNVHCVFDPTSGAWLKLPLSWELHSPEIKIMIDNIQDTIPTWTDRHEILALLRQCNYDSDEVVATFLAILQDDFTWRRHFGKLAGADESGVDHGQSDAKIKLLKRRVSELEALVKAKDSALEDSLEVNRKLKTHLSSSETMVRELQGQLTCIQRDIKVANEKLHALPSKPAIEQHVHPPTPVGKKVAPKTVIALKRSLQSLSKETSLLREVVTNGMAELCNTFQQAAVVVKGLRIRDQIHGSEVTELRRLYQKEALHRKLLYNKLQELRGNIRVFCRCRFDPAVEIAVNFPSDQEIQTKSQLGLKTFMFDRVFSPSSTQEHVFEDTLPLITSCADGYNVCIMAYGQTGAGKTFTMMGPDSNPGVNVRSIVELLHICKERKNIEYTSTVSMLEVYNETLKDLLAEFGSGGESQLNIHVKGKQVVVTHLAEVQVNSADSIKKIMTKGNANRSVGETKMNTNSSRSHLVLVLRIQGVDNVSHAITHGTLTLVDLAGSERISKTEATGQRLVEAAAINKSLSALGQVFTALRTNAMHVPYRNSKLTQLLQSSLGGDGKACLFVNVSPAESNLSETLSTLQFGSSARQVQLGKATQNITKIPK